MTDTPSGLDLARQALAAYKATAKNTPAAGPKKARRTVRPARGEGRDPQGLGNILGRLTTEQGWTDQLGGGNIIDRWTELCPTVYVDTTQPVGYDPDTGTLTLRTASHTIATGLRMAELMLVQSINGKLGRAVVRKIRVTIGTGAAASRRLEDNAPEPSPDPEASVRNREDGCPGYQDARAVVLEHQPTPAPVDPHIEQAMRRQEAALRAGRPPETEHRDAIWAQEPAGPVPGSAEDIHARARAYARQQRAGRAPRRAFDVA